MRWIWPLCMNVMLSLTALTILTGVVMNHSIDAILLRSTLVLIGSGLLLMLIALLVARGHRQQLLDALAGQSSNEAVKKSENASPSSRLAA